MSWQQQSISLLPALVVGNASVKVAAIIMVDGVALNLGKFLVNIEWRSGC